MTESCKLVPREGCRRIVFTGSDSSYEGYFIDWLKDEMGRIAAVIEGESGRIHVERSIANLEFVDKWPE